MPEAIAERLKAIVGAGRVDTRPKTLEKYSKDQSFVRPCTPDFVVYAESVPEVQDIIKAANETKTPVVPVSSGMNLRGAAIPKESGIILDMSRMNKIDQINNREGWAVVGPGVTYGQLSEALEKQGLRVMIPMGAPRSRSVITSVIENDPTTAGAHFEYGNNLYLDVEIVMPTGWVFRVGKWRNRLNGQWSSPGGGGHVTTNQYPWMWENAVGSLGVITGLVVKAEWLLPQYSKVFVMPFDSLEEAIEPLKRIQRKEMGLDCFLLNSFNLAAVRTDAWDVPDRFPTKKVASDGFLALRGKLPRWTLVVHLAALPHFPEEKIAWEEEALKATCAEVGLKPLQTVGGEEGLEATLLDLMLHPWQALKKAHFKGSFHPVTFYTVLGRAQEFEDAMVTLAQEYDYAPADIGGYMLPVERGRNCYMEFDFHCDLNDPADVARVKELWLNANRLCADMGALLAKPYGPCAELIYGRVQPTYVDVLRRWKGVLDPNNIMNPGQLCFY